MNSPLLLLTLGFVYVLHHDATAYRMYQHDTIFLPKHTFSEFGCSSESMTDTERKVFLNYHNRARLRVAKGIEPNRADTLSPAKNMYKLEWDCDMEEEALNTIENDCAYFGDSMDEWNDMSMNLDIRYHTERNRNHKFAIKQVLDDWWSVARRYGVNDMQNRYVQEELASFAKMVFSKATKIGCAYKVCDDGNMATVCLYNKIATLYGQQMWETGKACKRASDCTTYNNSSCDLGLCVKDGVVGSEEEEEEEKDKTIGDLITPTLPVTPVVTSTPSAPSIQCSDIGAMTDEARGAVLTMHNTLRSSVARGLEKDGLGGNAPKASKMLKMIYDCELEASAMNNAKHCTFEHSNSEFGENLFMTSELNLDKAKAVTEASQEWWDELKKHGIGQDNVLTQQLFYSTNQVGHYAQMAWETSYKLGCAAQHCNDMTYVVCQYAPGGNVLNRLIYTPGEPCQTDDGCPGTYTCSKDEGLCNVV